MTVIMDKTSTQAAAPGTGARVDERTRQLLEGPIAPTLLRLATPNVLVMLMQASVGLIETYFVAKLGTDALAGVALVFPVLMLSDRRRNLVRHRPRWVPTDATMRMLPRAR